MTHDERIERIARIIDPEAWANHPHYDKGNRPMYREISLEKARAADRATLEAIREIAGDAHAAGYVEFRKHTNFGVGLAAAHTAMIDHLLNANPTVEDERIAAMENK